MIKEYNGFVGVTPSDHNILILSPDKMQNKIIKYKIICGPSNIKNILLDFICVRLLAHMDKRKLSLGLEISDQI